MATSDMLIYNSTTLSATITMQSLGTNSATTGVAWQGNTVDFGTPRGEAWLARLQGAMAATPVAGGTVDLYMAWSSASATLANSNFPGGCTGVDGTYTGPSAVVNQGLKQLEFIGSLVVAATNSTVMQIQHVGLVFPKARFGVPVLASFVSSSVSNVFTSNSNMLMFTEIRPQAQ